MRKCWSDVDRNRDTCDLRVCVCVRAFSRTHHARCMHQGTHTQGTRSGRSRGALHSSILTSRPMRRFPSNVPYTRLGIRLRGALHWSRLYSYGLHSYGLCSNGVCVACCIGRASRWHGCVCMLVCVSACARAHVCLPAHPTYARVSCAIVTVPHLQSKKYAFKCHRAHNKKDGVCSCARVRSCFPCGRRRHHPHPCPRPHHRRRHRRHRRRCHQHQKRRHHLPPTHPPTAAPAATAAATTTTTVARRTMDYARIGAGRHGVPGELPGLPPKVHDHFRERRLRRCRASARAAWHGAACGRQHDGAAQSPG